MHTLRDFSRDMRTPDELREEIFCRLSESEVSKDLQIDFKQNKKLWIKLSSRCKGSVVTSRQWWKAYLLVYQCPKNGDYTAD